MIAVGEFAERLARLWHGRSQVAGDVATHAEEDFCCGYASAVACLGWRFGIVVPPEETYDPMPPARTMPVEPSELADMLTRMREEIQPDRREDERRPEHLQAPAYFRGYERALCDVAQEFGLG
jgi:hypothetical protein